MTAINQQYQQKDSTFTLCGSDRIHPDNDGHMVMAYLFLKAQGFVGKEVADMEINANKKQAVKSENCTVSNIKKNGKDLSFDYLAEALPYPLDTIARGWGQKKSQAEVLKVVPFMEEMNRETLKVTGLKGNYKLLIDDEEIGTWSGDELAKGINLAAESKTPQYQQALTVMHLNEYRWEIERTFREYAWCEFGFFQQKGLLYADDRKAIEVMDENLDKNVWLKGRRDMYSKMMFEAVRDARQQEMDVLINKIYEINNEEINYLNELRKKIINPIINLEKKINKKQNIKNIIKELYLFLINENIENKLNKKIKELENKNNFELAKEYKISYEIIINIFDEISNIFNNEEFTLDNFYKIFKIGLKNSSLGKIPASQDGVTVGDTERSRTHKVKAIFIIGLNDGVFPSVNKDEGFINDTDRSILKEQGIELAKGTIENLYDDNFNIYKAFTTAEEKLFLSYCQSDTDGKSLRPSTLILKIKKIFPELKENKK